MTSKAKILASTVSTGAVLADGAVAISDISGLQTAIDAKLSLTGGTLTGALLGTTLTMSGAGSIEGLTVGRGAGAVSTNTAVGASALAANTSGSENTAIGFQALQTTTTGVNNNAFGVQAMRYTTTGQANTAMGRNALYDNTTGSYNTAYGSFALNANTTASNNTAVGYQAGFSNTTGYNLAAFGNQALYYNTTGALNTAMGDSSLISNTTGSANTAVGRSALGSNTTASNNTAVGYQAGYSNTTGGENTAIGYQALYTNTTSGDNVAVGRNVLKFATGAGNTVIGEGGGSTITTGGKNTILGRYNGNQGGLDIRTSSNYIVLSDGDGNPRLIADNDGNWVTGSKRSAVQAPAGCIFYGTGNANAAYFTGDGSNAIYVNRENSDGNVVDIRRGATSVGNISVTASATAYNTSSDYRLKENIAPMTGALAKVAALKPVTYTWKADGSAGEGFIAHELQAVVPDAVAGEKDAVNEDGSIKPQGIDTSFLVATLTAAIQELKAEFDAYKATHP